MNDEVRMTNAGNPAAPGGRTDDVALPEIRHPKFVIPLLAWVAAGFLFLGLLWTAMFIASRRIDTRTVPLATTEAKP